MDQESEQVEGARLGKPGKIIKIVALRLDFFAAKRKGSMKNSMSIMSPSSPPDTGGVQVTGNPDLAPLEVDAFPVVAPSRSMNWRSAKSA